MNFNSRPSARGDGAGATATYQRDVFQFTPLREGRQAAEAVNEAYVTFQFTPLREGRRAAGADGSHSGNFNSRPSARGDSRVFRDEVGAIFQFTPLREGRLTTLLNSDDTKKFQFTPLREGRQDHMIYKKQGIISIHAPPRGATPRLRHQQHGRAISIHAPPRGATYYRTRGAEAWAFQFTPLREGRRRKGRQ